MTESRLRDGGFDRADRTSQLRATDLRNRAVDLFPALERELDLLDERLSEISQALAEEE